MQVTRPRVLLVEPNYQLRAAILSVLGAEHYAVETRASLEQIMCHADDGQPTIALVAWQSMNGLLAEEQRHMLKELAQRVRLVVMVPRSWARLLESTDLASVVAGLVAKPVEADELLAKLERALAMPVE